MPDQPDVAKKTFQLEEATIEELQQAIRDGKITCVQIVQHYLARARAYNGACSLLVTEDGKPVPEARGTVRAGAPLKFPAETVKASTLLPDLDNMRARRWNSAAWSRRHRTLPFSSNSA